MRVERRAARSAAGHGADAAQAGRRHLLAQGGRARWSTSCCPARWRARDPAISTVGRLDKDTSGLLLLTDDGALLHRIISPRHHVAKRYLATLARPLQGGEAERFASGELMLEGEDKPLAPAVLEPLSAGRARD